MARSRASLLNTSYSALAAVAPAGLVGGGGFGGRRVEGHAVHRGEVGERLLDRLAVGR